MPSNETPIATNDHKRFILENSKACQQKHGNKQRQRLNKDDIKSKNKEKRNKKQIAKHGRKNENQKET
jgi:hypothetical protein